MNISGLRGRMTTCNLDTPHFAFITNKLKLINKKMAVTGPVHPEFEGVPIPIYIPFGFFPLSQGRHSGILPPTFNASEQFGLSLDGLGYYKVINDYFDATIRANLYSYGGWNLYLTPTYRKRYKYNGSLNFALQRTRLLTNDAKNEFQDSKTFNITWAHTMDPRARPGTTFSASVNAGSTKFNQFVSNNPTRNFQNQLNSSITYTKAWANRYNLSLSATHNQNNNTGLVNLSLPNLNFNVTTLYPFQKKDFVGQPKWYEKLGIGLNSNVANQISFYDSLFSFRKIIDTIQWGAQHSIPIQLSLPPIGPSK
ncbi:MAG: LPS-assembly protein LptD [Chitinophagaceae bacterium]|nr:LPS-assembly protein LptD [Chitinophagaceae bacterium]